MFRKKNLALTKSPSAKCVAVSYGGNENIPVFEQTRYMEFYVIENGKKKQKQMISLGPVDTEGRVKLLREMKTDYVISKNFGPRSLHELKRFGMHALVFDGGSGAAFREYTKGTLREM